MSIIIDLTFRPDLSGELVVVLDRSVANDNNQR